MDFKDEEDEWEEDDDWLMAPVKPPIAALLTRLDIPPLPSSIHDPLLIDYVMLLDHQTITHPTPWIPQTLHSGTSSPRGSIPCCPLPLGDWGLTASDDYYRGESLVTDKGWRACYGCARCCRDRDSCAEVHGRFLPSWDASVEIVDSQTLLSEIERSEASMSAMILRMEECITGAARPTRGAAGGNATPEVRGPYSDMMEWLCPLGIDTPYIIPWTGLKVKMTAEYYLRNKVQKLEQELWNLTVKGDDIFRYTDHFHELEAVREAIEGCSHCTRSFGEYNDLLASNDALKQRLETKFKFLKHDNSLEKMFEMIEQEYESNVSKISITSSTFETKNLELVKEMRNKVKYFKEEKKVFETKILKLENVLAQRVKDFDGVKTEL
nr:hypothetical protein [Tanacetum cinerariifolium]